MQAVEGRFVTLKSQEQLDIQALHRVRSRLVGARTALINQLRALLLERGTTVAQGRRTLEKALEAMLLDGELLAEGRMRSLIVDMRAEWVSLDRRIEALDQEFAALALSDDAARRLTTIPGIGPLNATALVAAVGRADSFAHARDLGAWLGLVPRQHSTGGKPRLLGISKRGNVYLRTLLIHCARAALVRWPPAKPHWASGSAPCWRDATATRWSLRLPTSSRGSPGHSCAGTKASRRREP